jgi:hypothetical protein
VHPDGGTRVVASGDGARAAEEWAISAPVQNGDHIDAERLAALKAAHDDWSAGLAEAQKDGRSITHLRELREAYTTERPEPDLSAIPQQPARPTVSPDEWWCARLEDDEQSFEVWLKDATVEFPRRDVASVLTDFQTNGWTVCHVAEERRAVHDETQSRTEVTGAWLLLVSGGGPAPDPPQ